MLPPEIIRMYDILVSFLGDSKSVLDDSLQIQFSCPRCQDREGSVERNKYHLEVNLAKGLFHCWKCSSIDDGMKGSIYKLIRKYGNNELLRQFKDAVSEFRQTSLFKIKFGNDDFAEEQSDLDGMRIELPKGYVKFKKGKNDSTRAFEYLQKRGIDWSIIEDFHLGFTGYCQDNKKGSNRIILPSFDQYGDLNYWTGRDFTGNEERQRYDNPKVDRKSIIFNEEKVVWNADITLVEGPFDSIVVPNSIPLLGKQLNDEFKLYHELFKKSNANILIFLDNDAIDTAIMLYRTLDQGRLRGRIRIVRVPVDENDLDPSKIFQLWGRKGIIQFLNSAQKLRNF
jgi:DNA primase